MRRIGLGFLASFIALILAVGPVQNARAAHSSSMPARAMLSQVPVVTFKLPEPGTYYKAGRTIDYKAAANDPEDGDLAGSAFTWQVDFHHSGNVDVLVPPTTGSRSGSFIIPDTGDTATDAFYRITLTVIDSNGDSTTVTRDLLPLISTITIDSNPAGMGISIDGVPSTAPVTFDSVVGMTHTLGAEAPQMRGGSVWAFKKWSDRGAANHTIEAPAIATTYKVTYKLRDILNPSFEIDDNVDGAADFWTFINRYTTSELNEGLDCGTATDGLCSLEMYGNLSPSVERQKIGLKGEIGDSYTLDFSTRAEGIGASQATVELALLNADGTTQTVVYTYAAGTFDWTPQSLNITATKAYVKMWIYIKVTSYSMGYIWADDFDLTLN
jgi:hypothetical protein